MRRTGSAAAPAVSDASVEWQSGRGEGGSGCLNLHEWRKKPVGGFYGPAAIPYPLRRRRRLPV